MTTTTSISYAPLAVQQRLWRPLRAPPAPRGLASQPRRLAGSVTTRAESAGADPAPAASSSEPASAPSPRAAAGSALDSIPPEKRKQLITDGLAIKYVIKVGRQGASEGLATQIRQRWNTSEVRKESLLGS